MHHALGRPTLLRPILLRHGRARVLIALLALAGLALDAAPAAAEEPAAANAEKAPATRHVAYPLHGFSLDVPEGWTIEPYGGFTLVLTREHARLSLNVMGEGTSGRPAPAGPGKRIDPEKALRAYESRVRADEGPDADVTWRPWRMKGAQAAGLLIHKQERGVRILGLCAREADPRSGFELEVTLGHEATSLLQEVRALLRTMDLRPFEHPQRFIEHDAGWTLDPGYRAAYVQRRGEGVAFTGEVPEHDGMVTSYWIRPRTQLEGEPADVERVTRSVVPDIQRELEDVKLEGGDGPVDQLGGAYGRLLLRGSASEDFGGQILIEARVEGALEALAVTWRKQPEPKASTPAPHGNAWVPPTFDTPDHLFSRLATLREGAHPGPRKGQAGSKRPDRFARNDAPPLRFVLPSGWRLKTPSSRMRVAEVVVPGSPELVGAVYWFGADQGGSLEANMARWRRQMQNATSAAPSEIETVRAGALTVSTLDLSGSYAGMARPGATPAGPRPGMRMLASYLATSKGPMMIKFVAPEAAIAAMKPTHAAWIASMRLAPAAGQSAPGTRTETPEEAAK